MWRLVAVLALVGCVLAQVGTASAAGRTIVIELAGMGSSSDSEAGLFTNFNAALGQRGYAAGDIFPFSYSGWDVSAGSSTMIMRPFTEVDSCGPMARIVFRDLVPMIAYLHDQQWASHVALVGHSRGGLVAFNALMASPLAQGPNPFISAVVTADTPFQGISWEREDILQYETDYSCDTATTQLWETSTNERQVYSQEQGQARYFSTLGVAIHTVVNPLDCTFNPGACPNDYWGFTTLFGDASAGEGLGAPLNVVIPVVGQNFRQSHDAALSDPQPAAQIAAYIPAQGS